MGWYFIPGKAFPYECSNCGYGHMVPEKRCELCGEFMITPPEFTAQERWVICCGSRPVTILSSQADAEEYIFSLCEERAYKQFFISSDYLKDMKDSMKKVNDSRLYWSSCQKPYQTLSGYILNYCGNDLHLFKINELE